MRRRRKSKRRFPGIKSKIYWVIPFIFIISFILLFFKSGIFIIKQVEIKSDRLICADKKQIKDAANFVGQNFFLVNFRVAEEVIRGKYYCIKSVSMKKTFPDKVKLLVLSRQPAALLVVLEEKEASLSSIIDIATPSAGQVRDFYGISEEGVILSKETGDLNIPKIYIYDTGIAVGKKMEGSIISNALKILENIKQRGLAVKESWIYSDFFVVNSGSPALKMIFRLNEGLDIQLASLQLILDKAKIDLKELEFIDLRFDKPVVRFAPKKVL